MRALQLTFAVLRKRSCCRSRARDDALADRGGTFLGAFAGDVAVFDGRHFDVQIDAIEQRAGDALTIALDLHRAATAFAFQIAEIAARTGIHRRDQHELGGKRHAARRARNRDPAVFERLAHYFQCRAFELGQLIEKKNAVMREAHFARIRNCAAAEQADVADGVMRRAKRPRGDERLFAVQQAGDAVNLRRLDRFLQRHRRNDGGDAFRQHRFARAGRTDHEHVVTAGHRHFDRALHVALAFYVAEIDVVILVRRKEFAQIAARRQQRVSPRKNSNVCRKFWTP